MLSTLRTLATRVSSRASQGREEGMRHYRGFRLTYFPATARGQGIGRIDPMSDSAVAAWDRWGAASFSHEDTYDTADRFFNTAQSLCDRVLAKLH